MKVSVAQNVQKLRFRDILLELFRSVENGESFNIFEHISFDSLKRWIAGDPKTV